MMDRFVPGFLVVLTCFFVGNMVVRGSGGGQVRGIASHAVTADAPSVDVGVRAKFGE
jgi:hypothetical protein